MNSGVITLIRSTQPFGGAVIGAVCGHYATGIWVALLLGVLWIVLIHAVALSLFVRSEVSQ